MLNYSGFNEVKVGYILWTPLAIRRNVSSAYEYETVKKKKKKKKCFWSSGLWAAAPKHSRQLAGALIIAGFYTNTQACSCVCLLRLPRRDSSQGERMRNARIFKDSPLLPSAAASTIQCPKILLSVCVRVCVCGCECVCSYESYCNKQPSWSVPVHTHSQ